jgi:CheY-like chemotaxis protein
MRSAERTRPPIDILIAEDEAITRLALRQLLESEGYHCAEAADGREAVDIARQQPPRLLLLDLMMPELDGFAVARQLRSNRATRGVRILLLTGRNDRSARAEARRTHCELMLTKPLDFDGLLDVISTALHLGRRRARRHELPAPDAASGPALLSIAPAGV